MGYPRIKTFDKCLIERTIQNLDNYKGGFEFTHLINSLLTLIVLPHEYFKRKYFDIDTSFLCERVFDIKEIKKIFIGEEELSDENDNNYSQKRLVLKSKKTFEIEDEKEIFLKDLLEKLRHGIAHNNVRPATYDDHNSYHENSCWKGVIIRCYPPNREKDALEWNDNFTLEVYFNYEDLKTFSKYVSKRYLENIKELNS